MDYNCKISVYISRMPSQADMQTMEFPRKFY